MLAAWFMRMNEETREKKKRKEEKKEKEEGAEEAGAGLILNNILSWSFEYCCKYGFIDVICSTVVSLSLLTLSAQSMSPRLSTYMRCGGKPRFFSFILLAIRHKFSIILSYCKATLTCILSLSFV